MSDEMRTHLVTRFVCAKCGSNLRLSYNHPKKIEFLTGTPTGASTVETKIMVYPCETCLQPGAKLRAAVQTLLQTVEE